MSSAVLSPNVRASVAPPADYLFWSQFETELLWAWLCAYESVLPAPSLRSDRETLLQLLVTRGWSKKLKAGQEFVHLRMVWIQMTEPEEGAFVPGLYLDQPEDTVDARGGWTAQPIARAPRTMAQPAVAATAPSAAAASAASTSTVPAVDPLAFPCPHCHRTLHLPKEMQTKHAKACQARVHKAMAAK